MTPPPFFGEPRRPGGNPDGPRPTDFGGANIAADHPLSVDDLMDLIADDPPRRWLDLDDPDDFEEIANRIYRNLITRLRFDVLVERERSGSLLDFS